MLVSPNRKHSWAKQDGAKVHQESWPSSSLLVRPACMHEGHFISCCGSLCQNDTTCPPQPPLSLPELCSRICGLSSVSVTQYRRPRSLVVLTRSGLMQKDRLSHAAGDAPLACRLSLYLNAVLWMQPLPNHDTRCWSSRALQLPGPVAAWCIGITLHESVTWWTMLFFSVSPCSLKKRSFPHHCCAAFVKLSCFKGVLLTSDLNEVICSCRFGRTAVIGSYNCKIFQLNKEVCKEKLVGTVSIYLCINLSHWAGGWFAELLDVSCHISRSINF